jgi:hypothetical protein
MNGTPAAIFAVAPAGHRAPYLDLFKTILTVGMIFAHVIQLADAVPGQVAHALSVYVNLVTFSGFMLAFGMGIGLSRRRTSAATMVSRCKMPVLLFLGYCISSIAQLELVDGRPIESKEIIDVVLMRHLYGYSEFLATFFMLSLVTSFTRQLIFIVCDNVWLIIAFVALSVVVSALDLSSPQFPFVAAIIGSHDYPSFPLAQYLPWFLLGVRYTRRSVRISGTIWAAAGVATLAFVSFAVLYRRAPSRFPPDTLWIAGPALFLLIYLSLCHIITERVTLPSWIAYRVVTSYFFSSPRISCCSWPASCLENFQWI